MPVKVESTPMLPGLSPVRGKTIEARFEPQLDSGITSNNGGGQRALGDIPNVGVTTRVGTVR